MRNTIAYLCAFLIRLSTVVGIGLLTTMVIENYSFSGSLLTRLFPFHGRFVYPFYICVLVFLLSFIILLLLKKKSKD